MPVFSISIAFGVESEAADAAAFEIAIILSDCVALYETPFVFSDTGFDRCPPLDWKPACPFDVYAPSGIGIIISPF